MIRLNVPYRSQRGEAAPGRNDCGPACVAMVAGVDVATAVRACGQQPNRPVAMVQLLVGLRRLGIQAEYRRPLLPDDIIAAMLNQMASIVLVNYGLVPRPLKQDQRFQGSHFVVVIGYDASNDSFLVHDPNFDGDAGAAVVWPWEVVSLAMGKPGWGNMPNQGIVVPPAAAKAVTIAGDEEE